MENIDKIYELLDSIEVTKENSIEIANIRQLLAKKNFLEALSRMRELKDKEEKAKIEEQEFLEFGPEEEEEDGTYPQQLSNPQLEKIFIGMLLDNPKLISKYYFVFDDCVFEDPEMLNIYKSVLFNEGSKYSSEKAKDKFNFAKDSEAVYDLKNKLRKDVKGKEYNIEKVYDELKKLFILRKAYTETPERSVQEKIVEITDYTLYDKMSPEEIEDTIEQVRVTQKFKSAVLSDGLVNFLESGENELANGLSYPFPVLTEVFKGIRKGETMAYAMPSNNGKSRLTIDIAAFTAPMFGQACREYIERKNRSGALSFRSNKIGEWIGKTGTIDVVAQDEEGHTLIGLACLEKPLSYKEYEKLMFCAQKAKLLADEVYLFSEGFEEKLLAKSREDTTLRLVSLKDFWG